MRQVREAQEIKESLKCGFVVSRKIGNTVIGREIRAMAADQDIPILKSEIEQRVAYAESLTMGKTIFEWAPGSAAATEMENLTRRLSDNYLDLDLLDQQARSVLGMIRADEIVIR